MKVSPMEDHFMWKETMGSSLMLNTMNEWDEWDEEYMSRGGQCTILLNVSKLF